MHLGCLELIPLLLSTLSHSSFLICRLLSSADKCLKLIRGHARTRNLSLCRIGSSRGAFSEANTNSTSKIASEPAKTKMDVTLHEHEDNAGVLVWHKHSSAAIHTLFKILSHIIRDHLVQRTDQLAWCQRGVVVPTKEQLGGT